MGQVFSSWTEGSSAPVPPPRGRPTQPRSTAAAAVAPVPLRRSTTDMRTDQPPPRPPRAHSTFVVSAGEPSNQPSQARGTPTVAPSSGRRRSQSSLLNPRSRDSSRPLSVLEAPRPVRPVLDYEPPRYIACPRPVTMVLPPPRPWILEDTPQLPPRPELRAGTPELPSRSGHLSPSRMHAARSTSHLEVLQEEQREAGDSARRAHGDGTERTSPRLTRHRRR